ncbi:MAG: hypothetical protein EAZ73_13920 [Oscillatoriales cyanobacterium]|nr:MAG: hypothetical protein EAZ79_19805 [Oscillatoriales cyanobacterium]TAF19963.1 MAG: hypothetical protein EAZ73_13920 [Oscillatoriales cyanobacterium]
MRACSIALISRLAPDLVTPAIRRSSDTITLDNLLLNIDAFLNNFRDSIAGSYCWTVRAHSHSSQFPQHPYQPLQNFTKCVLWVKNKTDKPATGLAADIFSPKDLPCKDLGWGTPL